MFWGRLRQSAPVLCKKSLVSSQTAKIIASEMNKDGQSKKKINKCEIRVSVAQPLTGSRLKQPGIFRTASS